MGGSKIKNQITRLEKNALKDRAFEATQNLLQFAERLPVVGSLVAPVNHLILGVLETCQNVKCCREAISALQDRVNGIASTLYTDPGGLVVIAAGRDNVTQILNPSIEAIRTLLDEINENLSPYTKPSFFRILLIGKVVLSLFRVLY